MKELLITSNNFNNVEDESKIEELKKIFESCNINFLFGSGFSANLLDTLGNIENILEYVQTQEEDVYKIIEAITYWRFFEQSIYPVINLNPEGDELNKRIEFMYTLNQLIENRGNTTNSKRINVFTTNYDPVIELSFELNNIIYNDGFNGRIFPKYCTSNFNRTYYSQTIFTDKLVEIPVFNLVKIHGSMTWGEDISSNRYVYRDMKNSIENFHESFNDLFDIVGELSNELKTLDDVSSELAGLLVDYEMEIDLFDCDRCRDFIDEYKSQFKIINPTKSKFKETIFNKTYHELLRIYSNELEKINTALFVFGFSFKDEHIHEITRRALGNPTLKIYILAYKESHKEMYNSKFENNNNVSVIYYDESRMPEEDKTGTPILDLEFFTNILKAIMG